MNSNDALPPNYLRKYFHENDRQSITNNQSIGWKLAKRNCTENR